MTRNSSPLRVSVRWHRIFSVLTVLVIAASGSSVKAQASPDLASRANQAFSWWRHYREEGLPPVGVSPPLAANQRTVVLAPGMSDFATAEYAVLASGASGPAPALRIAECRSRGVQVLANTRPKVADVCVRPVAISSLFVECASLDLEAILRHLQAAGIDPTHLPAAYDPASVAGGLSEADWNVFVLRGSKAWTCFRGGLDFLLARQLASIRMLPDGTFATEDALTASALQITAAAGREADVTPLLKMLRRTSAGLDTANWGVSLPSDAQRISSSLDAALKRGALAKSPNR